MAQWIARLSHWYSLTCTTATTPALRLGCPRATPSNRLIWWDIPAFSYIYVFWTNKACFVRPCWAIGRNSKLLDVFSTLVFFFGRSPPLLVLIGRVWPANGSLQQANITSFDLSDLYPPAIGRPFIPFVHQPFLRDSTGPKEDIFCTSYVRSPLALHQELNAWWWF